MTDLTPICALGAEAPQQARFGALHLAENPGLGLASLALRRGQSAADPALPGLTLPGLVLPGPGGWAGTAGLAAFWTGPDMWMIEGPGQAEADFAAQVKAWAPGASVTEQTDAWAVIEIASSAGAAPLEALLARLVNIDLAGFGPGRAMRTGLEHLSVFVIRRAEDRVAVLAMRSAAETVWHALTTVARRQERGGP